jgi:hypothetical protein
MSSLEAWSNTRELMQQTHIIGRMIGFKDLTPLHHEWIKEIALGDDDYTLQAHRGSYKSSSLAVAIALIMILYPKRNIIFLRKTDNDVAEMMGMVSKILRSKIIIDLANIVHDLKKSQTVLKIASENQESISTNLWKSPMGAPQLRGKGIKSSITGSHAWYVITDDICNLEDRISRSERERTKLQYDELQNIRNRGGRIINLGTPWHKEDVFSKMPNINRYDCYHTGLITPEKLQELRNSMTPSLFAANYELKHIANEDALFKTPPQFFNDPELLRDGISHVDAAYSGKDSTAFTCGRYRDGIIYLYGRIWRKHVEDVMDTIIYEADRLMCWPLYNENNGDKGFVNKEFRLRNKWSKEYRESQNKYVKISSHLKKWWPNIRFLEGTDPEYISEIMDYTEDAEHDDAPDSAACVCRILGKYRRPEEEKKEEN